MFCTVTIPNYMYLEKSASNTLTSKQSSKVMYFSINFRRTDVYWASEADSGEVYLILNLCLTLSMDASHRLTVRTLWRLTALVHINKLLSSCCMTWSRSISTILLTIVLFPDDNRIMCFFRIADYQNEFTDHCQGVAWIGVCPTYTVSSSLP
jgi:hypothetical protein